MTNTNERPAEEGEKWEKELSEIVKKNMTAWTKEKKDSKIDSWGIAVWYEPMRVFIRTLLSRTRKEAEEKAWRAAVEAVPKQVADGSEDMDDAWRMAGLNEARAKLITAAKYSGVNMEI